VTGRRRLGLVAASATLLAAAPLSAIFESWTWLMQCILAVGLIAGGGVLARTLRFPLWAQTLSMTGVLLFVLTWMFPSGEEFVSLIPTMDTFQHFGQLFTQAGEDTRNYGVPVPNREGLLFITVLGVGGCAVVVDLFTVGLRKPALAGLPMLAIYSVPVAVYVDSVPVLPFIVGAAGFLWLLVADNVDRVRRFGRRFTGDGRDVDVWEPSPLAAAGRRIAVIGVAVAVLLPLAVPGLTTGLLSRLTQVGSGNGTGGFGSGGNGRVNLFASLSGSLTQEDTRDMIRVTTTEQDPFYLRLGVADLVNESGFANRAPTGRSLSSGALTDPREGSVPRGVQFQQYRANVEILDLNMGLAPIYTTTISMEDLGNSWSYDRGAQVIFSSRNSTKDKNYSFDYVRARYSPEALRQAPKLLPTDQLVAQTSVPADPVVDPLVKQLTAKEDTEYDKVRAIYDYFSKENGFAYNLTTSSGTAGSDIAAFLDSKIGFCQQYAAAMAWMVRAAGIPARVAFGFTRGSDRDGNTWTVTNRNAHAWTEVYFDGFGWVPFDATPVAGVAGASRSDWAPDIDRPDPVASSSTSAVAPGTDPSTAPNADPRAQRGFDDPSLAARGGIGATPASTPALWIAGIAALVIALLLVPAVRRTMLRRRRHAATVPRTAAATAATSGAEPAPGSREVVVTMEAVRAREDAHAAWDELLDTMIDFRVPVDPTETPRHTAQRLVRDAELEPAPAESATLLGSAEERARYARRPLQGGELTEALGRVRKGLARNSPRRTRMLAVLMPPSVLLRWRLALGDASARWVEFFSRMRDLVVRFSPRRLLANRAR
jgi:transglutaminase-like putative cysteine protease